MPTRSPLRTPSAEITTTITRMTALMTLFCNSLSIVRI